MPAKQSRQLACYDLIAQRFVPGVRYTELEVNRELMTIWTTTSACAGDWSTSACWIAPHGQYWRSGGTVDVGPEPAGEADDAR